MDKRKQVRVEFQNQFQTEPKLIVRAPGRINIIGEHTDYNNGWVLPAAIDKAAWVAMGPSEPGRVELYAADLQESYQGRLDALIPLESGSWPNYLLGVLAQFQKKGIQLPGIRVLMSSDVPLGAGLSSSAAIECAMAVALDSFLDTNISRIDLVKMAQKAEHEFAGVLCGIMDQFASMMGRANHAVKLDCETLDFEYQPLQMEGYKWLLLNTHVKHSLASTEYNTRRLECERGVELVKARYPSVDSLRYVELPMLEELVRPVDEKCYRRCRYVVEENARLAAACDDLKRGDLAALGKRMFETHEGLSQLYEVSCKELDWLVQHVKGKPGLLGARLMGGGFGGCTINLIEEKAIEPLLAEIGPAYEEAMQLPLTAIIASIDNGASVVE